MPKTISGLRGVLLRLGAESRLDQLAEERAAIYATFPDLRQKKKHARARIVGVAKKSTKRAMRLTDAQRRKLAHNMSVRMKAYWAARRNSA